MLTLQAMLSADCMPGEMNIEQLTAGFAQIARRSATLRSEIEADIDNLTSPWPGILREIPSMPGPAAEAPGKALTTSSTSKKVFRTTFGVPKGGRELFRKLVEEIVEWRLAEYLGRPSRNTAEGIAFVCKVSHANRRPILFLPDRSS